MEKWAESGNFLLALVIAFVCVIGWLFNNQSETKQNTKELNQLKSVEMTEIRSMILRLEGESANSLKMISESLTQLRIENARAMERIDHLNRKVVGFDAKVNREEYEKEAERQMNLYKNKNI